MTAAAKPAAPARRYAILLALWDSDYAQKAYGGYHNVFVAALGGCAEGEPERWDSFRVIGGEFPATEDLASYDGFVVSGSPRDAHGDDEPWVRRLCALLWTLHAMRKRVLGVCFGHQVLCRALGGRVGRASGGWDVAVRKVTFVQNQGQDMAAGLLPPFLDDVHQLLPRRTASIIEVHQDEVWEIPPTATVLAYSEKTRVEAFVVGEHALGIQGHPEYTLDILHNLIDRLADQNDIQRSVAEEARRTAAAAETGVPDRVFWTALCKAFLRGGGGGGTAVDGCDCGGSRPVIASTAAAPEVVSGRAAAAAAASCFTGAAPMVQLACRSSIN